MHSFETIMAAVERQFNIISPTGEVSLLGLAKLSMDGYMSVAQPATRNQAMAVIASFHLYRHRLSAQTFQFYADNMRKVMAMYSGLRAWRLSHYAVTELLDYPASAMRTARLAGTWGSSENYRSGSFSYNSFKKLLLYNNGYFKRGSSSYASDTYRYSDGQYRGSSSTSSEGDWEEGYWGNSFDDFYLAFPQNRTFIDYDCRVNGINTLILTPSGGSAQYWDRQ